VPETCGVCKKPAKNLCTSCRGVHYCCRDCQSADWKTHKTICKTIRQKLQKYNDEHQKLLNCDDNFSGTLMNYFTNTFCIGRFWGLHETRPYCRSLSALVQAYDELNTPLSRKEAILLCMHLFRCNRGDNMGIRDIVTDIMLRAGLYQETYDFIKWQFIGPSSHYDWGNNTLPFLSYRFEDRTEPFFTTDQIYHTSINHLLVMVVVKYQAYEVLHARKEGINTLLLGAQHHENPFYTLAGCPGLIQQIVSYAFDTLPTYCKYTKDPAKLRNQIFTLLGVIHKQNPLVLLALINPKKLMSLPKPQFMAPGEPSEAYSSLEVALPTWEKISFSLGLKALVREYLLAVVKVASLDYKIPPSRVW